MIAVPVNLAKDPGALADLITQVYSNPLNSITGRDALLLHNAVTDLRAAACQHQNIEVFAFNADRFSGSCRDSGADVRSPA